jgi:tRNA(Ile)-lysidine synthase
MPTAADPVRTLPRRVREAVRREGLWAPGDGVLLAVSGGVDSVALLDLLAGPAAGHGGRLVVASVDHGLRAEAAAEVAAVGALAAARGLPFVPVRLALSPGPDLANRARLARRAALVAAAAEADCARIATAHHADDQAETLLQHLLRGAGLAGARAMRPLDPPFCRPLLAEPRSVLAAWVAARGLPAVDDPSNPGSMRGQLRPLLAGLEALRPGAGAALARSAALLAVDDAFVDAAAAALGRAAARPPPPGAAAALDHAVWVAGAPAVRARAVYALLPPAGRESQTLRALAARGLRPGGLRVFPGGWQISREGPLLVLRGPGGGPPTG